jgi:5'-3' exonuclease
MNRGPLLFKHAKITTTTMILPSKKKLFCLTAAAAFSSSAQAWVLPAATQAAASTSHRAGHLVVTAPTTTFLSTPSNHNNHYRVDTRLYSSRNNKDDPTLFSKIGSKVKSVLRVDTRLYSSRNNKDDPTLLSKIGRKVKSVLPTKWFGTKEEKKAQLVKKEATEQVTGAIQEMLKDAPSGIRMLGKMIAPLVGKMASTMAATMKDQQEKMQVIMEDTQRYLVNDDAVTSVLGTPIQIGAPTSQSSSTSSINGKTQSRIQLGMPVTGSIGSGVVRVMASQDGISQLQVEVGGQVINVNLSGSSSKRRSSNSGKFSSSGSGRDNIIEAEIIDKEMK